MKRPFCFLLSITVMLFFIMTGMANSGWWTGQQMPQTLGTGSSPTFVGETLSGLTASRGVVTDGNKALTSDDAATGSGAPVRANAPSLTNPDVTTQADNNATTKASSTAYAKSQLANVANPRAISQAIWMTAAASGSTGITVADNDNIDFGTRSFAIGDARFYLADWTPSADQILLQKWTANVGYEMGVKATTGYLYVKLNTTTYTSSVAPSFANNTWQDLKATITAGAVNTTVDFSTNGVALGVQQTAANPGTVSSAAPLYILGTSAARTAGGVSAVRLYNYATSTTTDIDIYRNGVAFADKWGSQTEQTSGTLTIGKKYRINNWITDDDFTNVGGANVDGTEFTATGTTPTKWTNSSTVVEIGATLALEPEGIMQGAWVDSSSNKAIATYPTSGTTILRPQGKYTTTSTQAATASLGNNDMAGQVHRVTGAYVLSVPTVLLGHNACFLATTAATYSVDVVTGTDILVLNGTALTAGNKITSGATIYEKLCCEASVAGVLDCTAVRGVFTDGG